MSAKYIYIYIYISYGWRWHNRYINELNIAVTSEYWYVTFIHDVFYKFHNEINNNSNSDIDVKNEWNNFAAIYDSYLIRLAHMKQLKS